MKKVGRRFAGNDLKDGSVGRDHKRADEEYDPDESAFRTNLARMNEYHLVVRHEPERRWNRQHAMEISKSRVPCCCVCKLYYSICLLFI
jgi:hypothetical protein